MFNVEIQEEGDGIRLSVSGELSFQYCPQLHAALSGALYEFRTIEVLLDGVSSFDLCGVQLLFSAERTASLLKKKLNILPGRHEEYLKKMLTFSGFEWFAKDAP